MKKIMFVALMMVMTISANAMSYPAARSEALFLSDKMAYELNLTAAQYDAVYEINLDYMMSVNGRDDVFGLWWNRRNTDLKYVLTVWQYEKYMSKAYFYRPLTWNSGSWTFNVYRHYSNKGHYYMAHPKAYTSYKGGNNRKGKNYYADKKFDKPAPRHGNGNGHNGNSSSWRSNAGKGSNTGTAPKSNDKSRRVAQNTGGSKSGNFGGRR